MLLRNIINNTDILTKNGQDHQMLLHHLKKKKHTKLANSHSCLMNNCVCLAYERNSTRVNLLTHIKALDNPDMLVNQQTVCDVMSRYSSDLL